jgi:peptidylprolyl isomerase
LSLKLEDVKGIGKKVGNLKEAGIDTVEKLATSSINDLLSIKGIGKASAEKFINSAKELLETESPASKVEAEKVSEKPIKKEEKDEEKEAKEDLKKLEEKKKRLQGKKVEKGDFVLVKITGKTQKGTVFRVSSEEDAKKAGIYEEQKAKQGYYTPEFVIVGKPGFLNEGLTETIEDMNYFEKKSVRIPPTKAFGKRDPQKIERVGIAKFRKLNEGKNPEIGQEFVKKGTGQRGVVTNVVQGKVIVDYNHPLAGQSIDYNLEIVDNIENFDEKIEYFMISKGIPKENISDFKINYIKDDKTLEILIPKMFLFQNLTYIKFGLALDLQTHLTDEINDVKFIEVYEKMPLPTESADSVMKKVEEYNKEQDTKTE